MEVKCLAGRGVTGSDFSVWQKPERIVRIAKERYIELKGKVELDGYYW